MIKGFYINRLLVSGSGVENAFIRFSPFVHVIIGPSNTGKTYIFQCIKYMLGSSKLPKKIKESALYDSCYLEIVLPDNAIHTIYRDLSGGHAKLYECPYEEIKNYTRDPEILYIGNPTKNNITLSEYFLRLSKLNKNKVRRNLSGVTDEFSFADLRHLTLIDEGSIIKEESPIFTGQRGEDTKEKSALKFLLTGKDDSHLKSKPKPKVIDNRKGKLEIIAELIKEYKKDLSVIKTETISNEELLDQIGKLEKSVSDTNDRLIQLYDEANQYDSTTNSHWLEWKENESRLITINELLARFSLLKQHYENDILRLEAIQEASKAFSLLDIAKCPICDSEVQTDGHEGCNPETIINASGAEILKIQILQQELVDTTTDLNLEKNELTKAIEVNKSNHHLAQSKASEFVSKNIRLTVQQLDKFKFVLEENRRILKIIEKLNDLVGQQKLYEKEIDPMDGDYSFDELTTSLTIDLCTEVKKLLDEWGYEEITTVSFSEETYDLVINGFDRTLSGKGYRALVYSAFTIGLMHVCHQPKLAHSGVVILDSPLCTLRSRHFEKSQAVESKDLVGDETKEAFYLSLSKIKDKGQIIILDNDGPAYPSDLGIGYTEFTRNNMIGRYGFYKTTTDSFQS